jgi:hypothetical protein
MIYPALIPALPRPAIARPMISTSETGAAPQIRDPISNTATAPKNTHFSGKKVYSLP